MFVKKALDKFGKGVVKEAKTSLTKKKKKHSSSLYNSIKYDLKISKNSFELGFSMNDYGKFIDKGVKGVKSSAKAPNSPFKFGSGTGKKGGLTSGTLGWVKTKRIQFSDKKTGRFMSYKTTAFLIMRSIWNKGIATTNFFTKPFNEAFKRLPDLIVEAYALKVDDFLKYTLR